MTPLLGLVVPTLNPGADAARQAEAIAAQTLHPASIVVMDSESDDGSLDAYVRLGARVVGVERAAFQHGRVRNEGAAAAGGDVLVFLTQDALPRSDALLAALVAPIVRGEADASFARQVPRDGATPLERYARSRNYPARSRIVTEADVARLGVRACFFSNACSAVRRDTFERLGGFPTHTVMNEDMLFAARLLRAGGRIAYVANAEVTHSHDYGPWRTLQRYFDIGVFLRQAEDEMPRDTTTSEGVRYTLGLLRSLVESGHGAWLVPAAVETAAKAAGAFLGKRFGALPEPLVRTLSLHRGYWDPRGHPHRPVTHATESARSARSHGASDGVTGR